MEEKVIGGRWVYAMIKLGPDNEKHLKARYITKGF